MKLFKERLKLAALHLLFIICMIAFISVPYGLILLTGYIHENLPGIIVTILVLSLFGFWIVKAIYWLLIEPFKKRKEEQAE